MIRSFSAAVAALALALAGCTAAGLHSAGSLPATPYGLQSAGVVGAAAAKTATAMVTVVVPAHPPSGRHPADTSPATQGIDFFVTAQGFKPASHFFALTAKQSYCTGGTPQIALTCRLSMTVPASTDTFVVNTYATTSQRVPILATGRIVKKFRAGSQGTLNVTMYGAVKFLQIAFVNAYPKTGASASVRIEVTAADPWGYTIVGSYATPITLRDSDKSGATTLSATTLASSGAASKLKLLYTGKSIVPAIVTASVPAMTAQRIVFSPGGAGIVANPPLLRVSFGNDGTAVRLAGPGTAGPFTLTTLPPDGSHPSCSGFATVSGSGSDFVVRANGNLGACWLAARDGGGHKAALPVLISAFGWASPTPSPSVSPTPKHTPSPTPAPTATPSPTPSPSPTPTPSPSPRSPVIVTPAQLTICPQSGVNACTPDTAIVVVKQPGTPGTFAESDHCSPVATVKVVSPIGPNVRFRITGGSTTGSCVATFTGFGGNKGHLTIQVSASGIIINSKPHASHSSMQKEQRKR
jgi:hypothetical protein